MSEDAGRVRCAQCRAEGRTSTLEALEITVTAMAVHASYDEHGRPHIHDPNWHTRRYRCSNGHRFFCRWQLPCWCGWPHQPQD